METISDSILNRLKSAYDLPSDAALSRRLGVTAQTVSNWRRRGAVPFSQILSNSHDLNLNWLFRNVGSVFIHEIERQWVAGDRKFALPEDDLHVPIIGRKPQGATGPEIIDSISSYSLGFRKWLKGFASIDPEKAFITEVQGIGMMDLFRDGDMVIGERVDEIDREGIYAVWHEGNIEVRVARTRGDEVLLRGYDPAYQLTSASMEDESFQVIGKVAGGITSLLR